MKEENQSVNNLDLSVIDARPTKELFITMLVKDIPLKNAIIDLVDNSLDGAKNIREDGNYSGLNVRLELSRDKFKIVDNCGGIPVKTARNYAFRFGRTEDRVLTTEPVAGSIGEFGVGMKRTLFKIGNVFSVESIHKESSFSMRVNVDEWKKEEGLWKFKFKDFKEDERNPEDKWETSIIVTDLYPEISDSFGTDKFIRLLIEELEKAHVDALHKGLAITVNQIPARDKPLSLLVSKLLPPAYRQDLHRVGVNKEEVKVKIFAGISKSEPNEAGWYVFCNGRVILNANQTFITGWGSEPRAPKYHGQYARFRGFVFIDSDNPSLLPWNTTKTGIDEDSSLYKAVRLNMLTIMKSVISFLNKLDRERTVNKDMGGDPGPIERVVNNAELKTIAEIGTKGLPKTFRPKVESIPHPPDYGTIKYIKPNAEIDKIKKILKTKTNKEVGEKTFDYFFDSEVSND